MEGQVSGYGLCHNPTSFPTFSFQIQVVVWWTGYRDTQRGWGKEKGSGGLFTSVFVNVEKKRLKLYHAIEQLSTMNIMCI